MTRAKTSRARRLPASRARIRLLMASLPWLTAIFVLTVPVLGLADMKQVAVFDQDVQAFAISQDNHVVYAVERMKRIKKLIVEHDDFWVGET